MSTKDTESMKCSDPQQSSDWVLQLPGSALDCLLQQLDQRSLACTAVTCSTLSNAATAAVKKVAVHCSNPETITNFTSWVEQRSNSSSSLNNLTQCSIAVELWDDGWEKPTLDNPPHLNELPLPQLRELHLAGLEVQLESTADFPGVLKGCSGLTALTLDNCDATSHCESTEIRVTMPGTDMMAWVRTVDNQAATAAAAAAAIAALPELQSLELNLQGDLAVELKCLMYPELQHYKKLKRLCIVGFTGFSSNSEQQPEFDGQMQPEFDGDLEPDFDGELEPDFDGELEPEFHGEPEPEFEGEPQPDFEGQLAVVPPSQLPVLFNLEHLKLHGMSQTAIPGGLPSQLVKLTCLDLQYNLFGRRPDDDLLANQLQHLSTFTALQELSIYADTYITDRLPDLEQLSQLTNLTLGFFNFSTASTSTWAASLTALQRLALCNTVVEPSALEPFTQLRVLSLEKCAFGPVGQPQSEIRGQRGAHVEAVLESIANLGLLTELCFNPSTGHNAHPSAAAFTALTASTNLCVLRASWPRAGAFGPNPADDQQAVANLMANIQPEETELQRDGWVLFKPNTTYPHLRVIDLQSADPSTPLSRQQLQQMCSSCPNLESLAFIMTDRPSATACLPLLQLSALTHLAVSLKKERAPTALEATAAVVNVAAQLTGLKHLRLLEVPKFGDPVLMQLTALTALELLQMERDMHSDEWDGDNYVEGKLQLWNTARWFNPPDVWQQLLRHLSGDVPPARNLFNGSALLELR